MAGRRVKEAVASSRRNDQDIDVALQVMVPERLKREISVKAAKEGTTNRSIVLSALRAAGFEVSDEDMCDRGKGRG